MLLRRAMNTGIGNVLFPLREMRGFVTRGSQKSYP